MLTCLATGELNTKTAKNTADFVMEMDKLFDVLNSRSLFSSNPYRSALHENNKLARLVLTNGLQIFSQIQTVDWQGKVSRPPCFDGMIISISAILKLFEKQSKCDCQFLLTSRLNQDVIENFFQ